MTSEQAEPGNTAADEVSEARDSPPQTSDGWRPLLAGSHSERAEIVIGLVGALGTDLKFVARALREALATVGYSTSVVRVSDLIDSLAGDRVQTFDTTMDRLMEAGDELRRTMGHGSAAARLALAKIGAERAEATGTGTQDDQFIEREAHATIVRQLKHPEEVRLLRSVYGPRFVLIGGWAPLEERTNAVLQRLERDHPGQPAGWYANQQRELMERDEKDEDEPLGQRVRATFELADAYLALMPGVALQPDCNRLVRLLFGAPFETPTAAEQAMYQASGARLRSADAGRQVGAVVVDEDGEIVVSGTNEVPRAGGGQYWPTDEPDNRDFRYGYDINDRQKLKMLTEVLQHLATAGWLADAQAGQLPQELARQALHGPLADSQLGDLLEFGRIAHAEMAAICTAARRGRALRGLTMYTTTYPCHECARLIIATGIAKVVYVDPYTKSQVREMYRHEVADGPYAGTDKVVFEPFVGIAPRLYQQVFAMFDRRRDPVTGDYEDWEPAFARPRLVADAEATWGFAAAEVSAVEEMQTRLIQAGWLSADDVARERDAQSA